MRKRIVNTARKLRRDMTVPERLLWDRLKARQIQFKFRRQHPVAGFIADFCCPKVRLVIELDGRSHDGRVEEDREREAVIRTNEYRVLRLSNDFVLQSLDKAVEIIYYYCENPAQEPELDF